MVQLDPTLVPELRGQIGTEKKAYDLTEEIAVTYWLSNVSEKTVFEEVADGSTSSDVPFQGYSFDANMPDDKKVHLELKEAGTPLQGPLSLSPGEKRIFARNVFTARTPGTYALSFHLRWSDDKRVPFQQITIGVRPPQEETASLPADLEQALADLGSAEKTVKLKAREIVLKYEKHAPPSLVELLAAEDENLRLEAMDLLVRFGLKALPVLQAEHPDARVRRRIVNVLEEIGEIGTVPILASRLLQDPAPDVRQAALEAISRNFAKEIVIPLAILALKDEEKELRRLAFRTLRSNIQLDMDFPVEGSAREREIACNRWKEWWKERDPQAFIRYAPYDSGIRGH